MRSAAKRPRMEPEAAASSSASTSGNQMGAVVAGPFDNFPPELLEQILFNLDARSRYAIRSQNRDMRGTADSSWRDIQSVAVSIDSTRETHDRDPEASGCSMPVEQDSDWDSCSSSSSEGPSTARRVCRGLQVRFMMKESKKSKSVTGPFHSTAAIQVQTANPYTHVASNFSDNINAQRLESFLLWVGARLPRLSLTVTPCHLTHGAMGSLLLRPLTRISHDAVFDHLLHLQVRSCFLITDRRFLKQLIELAQRRRAAALNPESQVKMLKSLVLGVEKGCERHNDRRWSSLESQHLFEAEHQAFLEMAGHGHPEEDEFIQMMQHHMQQQQQAAAAAASKGPPHRGGCRIPQPDMKKLLQQLMDNCQGLLELDCDELLVSCGLAVTELTYPASLRSLKTDRLGSTPNDIATLVANCPLLESIKLDCGTAAFSTNQPNCAALAQLHGLKELSLQNLGTPSVLSNQVFGSNPNAQPAPNPWPALSVVTLTSCKLNNTFLLQLTRCCSQLQEVHVTGREEMFTHLTESGVSLLCELTQLRHLELKWNRNDLFGDMAVDKLGDHCPLLETLKVERCKVGPLSMPRLLRNCAQLRLVAIELALRLSTLDSLVMIRSMGTDVIERVSLTHVEVTSIGDASYEAVARILDGLTEGDGRSRFCEMVMSNLSDYCLHDREQCSSCLFDDDTKSGRRRVLVLGHKRNRNCSIVFSCKVPQAQV